MEPAKPSVSMAASHRKLVRSLTKETSTALEHVCKALVELVKYLLAKSHSYVLLGKLTTDALKKAFGKLRLGSGGTYFITIQPVLENLNISKATLILRWDIDLSTFVAQEGHFYKKCSYLLSEEISFDSLHN